MNKIRKMFLILALAPLWAHANEIDPLQNYAWAENAGWLNFRSTYGAVTVHEPDEGGYLSGYAWGENIGWIKLGNDSGGPYANTSATDWGVNLDSAGNLSGYAWSEVAGWINFDPSDGGVTVNMVTGEFDGYAWGENVGWIGFSTLGYLADPTSVVLYYFTVGNEEGRVVIRWRTASEENTVGFFVERWDGSRWVRVNSEILYARGEGLGALYSLVDAGAEVGGTYRYRLVEVETNGEQVYGPFERTASVLKFQTPIAMGGEGVRIRWLSREDEQYRILRSEDLMEGFKPIASGIPATPPENEYLDEDLGGRGMYMIQVDDQDR